MSAASKTRSRILALLLVIGCAAAAYFVWDSFATTPEDVDSETAEAPVPKSKPVKPKLQPPILQGRIVDDLSAGIYGATVIATCGDAEAVVAVTRSGRFSFKTLQNGRCELTAVAEGYVAAGPDPRARADVRVDHDTPLSGVTLRLNREAVVSGRVTAGGKPASRVALSVMYHEAKGADGPFSLSMDLRTDDKGNFRVAGLGPGRAQILAEHDEFGLAESAELFLSPADVKKGIDVALEHTGMVSGRVVDDRGRAVTDARITILRDGSVRAFEATTDGSGQFMFDAVPLGTKTVSAAAHGLISGRQANVDVAIGEETEVRFTLKRRTGFGGVVLRSDGTPAPKAAVYVGAASSQSNSSRPSAHSDAEGRFWIPRPPPPPSVVWARHPEFAESPRVAVSGAERDLEVTLGDGGRLIGQVVTPGGDPISTYDINASTSTRRHGPRIKVNDPTGHFELKLEPGRYAVVVNVPGKPTQVTRRFLVEAGRVVDAGRIVVGGGGALTGLVVDEDNKPLAGVRVRSEGSRMGQQGKTVTTSADGIFTLKGLAAGSESLYLRSDGFLGRMVSNMSVTGDQTTDVGRLMLQKSTGRSGMQYTGVGISIKFGDEGVTVAQSFEGGAANRAGLAAGTVITTVNGRPLSELNPTQIVQLIRGEPGSEVTLDIIAPGGTFPETIRLERSEVIAPGPRSKPIQPKR